MKKYVIAAGALGLIAAGILYADALAPAQVDGCQYLASPPTLSDKQTSIIQCSNTGALLTTATITGSVTANTAATATAAAPSYSEGTSDPLSVTLSGSLRTTGVGGSFPITAASGAIASGAIASGAIASGAVASGAYASGSYAAGAISDGADVTLGAKADATCATASGTCSLIALVKYLLVNGITALGQTTMSASIPVVIASDQSAVAISSPAIGATAAAPPASAVQVGAVASGATGGLTAGLKTCDLHAKYDSNDNGNITLVTGVASRKVYICGYILANGGTATNLSLTEGSDANCATSNAGLTPVYQIVANGSIGVMSPFWAGLVVSTNAYYVCVKSSAGNSHQAEIWYTIQ